MQLVPPTSYLASEDEDEEEDPWEEEEEEGRKQGYEGDEPGECSDDADNDQDGLFDCDDPNCAGSRTCRAEEPISLPAEEGRCCTARAEATSAH